MQEQSIDFDRDVGLRSNHKNDVAAVLDAFTCAIQLGDLECIVAFYADPLVAFDLMPPLQFKDLAKYKDISWKQSFIDHFQFPITYQVVDRKIHAEDKIAFAHGLLRVEGVSKKGEVMEMWMRNTTCLQRIGGRWKISHEHNSIPIESNTMKGMINLEPEISLH
ncbi:MAG: nuclear transport factor 2 family protein [Chitinophagaceae bacterium]|nr:nuclear transport factor 2 family protein [Oligoflexus sp.]